MNFKKSNNALLFWLIICDFFSKYNRASAFNQSEIGNGHAANLKKAKKQNKTKKEMC